MSVAGDESIHGVLASFRAAFPEFHVRIDGRSVDGATIVAHFIGRRELGDDMAGRRHGGAHLAVTTIAIAREDLVGMMRQGDTGPS